MAKEPASRFLDIRWPRDWLVLGPLPPNAPLLSQDQLRQIPAEVTLSGKTFAPSPLRADRGVLDFTRLYGGYGLTPLKPDQRSRYPRPDAALDPSTKGQVAYAFAEIRCPNAGQLLVGAGAEWWMAWYLDGKRIYDTLETGNLERPCRFTDHVFSTRVSAGEHVLAAMVKAGSAGWALASASGERYRKDLEFVPRDSHMPFWGYVSVTGDLLLGTCRGAGLFALDKNDGSVRWLYRAKHVIDNVAVAWGGGRVFLLDAAPRGRIKRATRRGENPTGVRMLVALDLATGRELWRQDDVPQTLYYVQYANGVVTVHGNAAYDAKTGRKLWVREVEPDRLPVIHGEWIIAEPQAYHLRTGAIRLAKDILSNKERPC